MYLCISFCHIPDIKPSFSYGGSIVHRFPGFAQGYAGGKRVEIKSTPSRGCRQFMMRKFDEVCRLVLKHKNSRNPLIQQTLLILLPRIAALNQELFALKYVCMYVNSRQSSPPPPTSSLVNRKFNHCLNTLHSSCTICTLLSS